MIAVVDRICGMRPLSARTALSRSRLLRGFRQPSGTCPKTRRGLGVAIGLVVVGLSACAQSPQRVAAAAVQTPPALQREVQIRRYAPGAPPLIVAPIALPDGAPLTPTLLADLQADPTYVKVDAGLDGLDTPGSRGAADPAVAAGATPATTPGAWHLLSRWRQDAQGALLQWRLLDAAGQLRQQAELRPRHAETATHFAHRLVDQIQAQNGQYHCNSARLAFVMVDDTLGRRRWRIATAAADGSDLRVVASSAEPLLAPRWSPDGRRLAFAGFELGQALTGVLDLASGQWQRLTAEPGVNGTPAWSPDGAEMAVTLSFGTNADIYLIDLQHGSQRQRLTEDAAIDADAVWAPDGRSLVFTSDREGSAQLYRVSRQGGAVSALTRPPGSHMHAAYSPDGQTLALVNSLESGYSIVLMDLRSGVVRRLGEGQQDQSPVFSPKGDFVTYAAVAADAAELISESLNRDVRLRYGLSGVRLTDPAWSPCFD